MCVRACVPPSPLDVVCVCVCASPFDVVRVPGVVSLQPLVHVEQHHHRGDEVHRLPGGHQVEVGAAVAAPVTVSERCGGQGVTSKSHGRLGKGLFFCPSTAV